MKRLNIKLAVSLVVGLAVLGVGVHFLHAFQVERNAEGVLEEAQEFRAKGDLEEARLFAMRYLNLRRGDESDAAKGMRLLAEIAYEEAQAPDAGVRKKRLAIAFMEEAVRLNPDDADFRRKLLDYHVKLGSITGALDHVKLLRDPGKLDAELELIAAKCYEATGDYAETVKICEMLVGYDRAEKKFQDNALGKDKVDAYMLLALVYRDRKAGTDELADRVIEQLVKVNDKSSAAHLAAYHYWKHVRNEEKATLALDVAYQLDSKSPEVLLPLVERALKAENLDEADRLLQAGLAEHPNHESLYRGLAFVALNRNQPAAAVKALEDGLRKQPESIALLDELLRTRLEQNELPEAKRLLKELKDLGVSSPRFDFYEGQILAMEQKWVEAIQKLEAAAGKHVNDSAMLDKIETLLGKCYQSRGDLAKAVELFRKVGNRSTSLAEADLKIAEVLASTGKNAEALAEYEKVAQSLDKKMLDIQQVWGPLIQLRTWDQVRKPKDKRDWSKVDALVEQLTQAGKFNGVTQIAIQGDLLAKKGDIEGARALYARGLVENPTNETLWLARITLELQTTNPEIALRLAEQVPPELQDGLVMRLMRASIFSRMDTPKAKAGLASLERDMNSLKPDEQYRLLHGLVQEYRRLSDRENAKRLLAQMMAQRKTDLVSRTLAFEIARETEDLEAMREIVRDVRKVAEANSPHPKVFDAVTTIMDVKRTVRNQLNSGQKQVELNEEQRTGLQQARRLLNEVVQTYTLWNEPHKWLADINLLEGNIDGTLDELRTAARKGALDAIRARQLYELLVDKGLHGEAEGVYATMGTQSKAGTEWTQVQLFIQYRRFDEAKALLDTMRPKENTPVKELLLYADARRRIGDLPEAEITLRQAVQTDATSAEAWVSLVNTLATAKKMSDAESAIESAKVRLPADRRDFVIAQCYEVMGDEARAKENYERMVAEKPHDLVSNQAVAAFYMRLNQSKPALKYLDTIVAEAATAKTPAEKSTVEWARRARAVAIASDGKWESFKKAEAQLLEREKEIRNAGGEPSTADLLLHIGLLSDRVEPSSLRTALKLFEDLQSRQPLQTNELVNMAQLYERVGEWRKAKEIMLGVLTQRRDSDPAYYLTFAQMLLQNGEYGDVETWLSSHDRIRGNSNASLPLWVTLRVRQDRQADIGELILHWLGPPQYPPARLPQAETAAKLLEKLEQYSEAEKIWREYVRTDPKGTLWLARCIGMYGDLDEAFAMLETASKYHSAQNVLLIGIEILRARKGQGEKKHFDQLGVWFAATRDSMPNDPRLDLILADIREMRGELDRAEEIYRNMLARKDVDPAIKAAVANNLAFILSTQNKNTDEAIGLIDRAMMVIGPSSDLLDTRGVVHLAAGKAADALKDFQEAVLVPTAMKWVHLAFAQDALGDKDAARASLKKAQEFDLKRTDLYPAEWNKYERLVGELAL
jgi:tetratricopeptide (TPR) repeat protein